MAALTTGLRIEQYFEEAYKIREGDAAYQTAMQSNSVQASSLGPHRRSFARWAEGGVPPWTTADSR
eukprot:3382081-Pyramimonas_sp.AAC.1